MNLKRLSGAILTLVTVLALMHVSPVQGQSVYTNTAKSKYVKTTVDTFVTTVSGYTQTSISGFVTNESATKQLYVYFAKTTGAKDTGTRVLLEPGKVLQFTNIKSSKIYREAVSDSVFSQVIIGSVQLNSNDSPELGEFEHAVFHFDNWFLKPEKVRAKKFIRLT